MSHVMSSQQTGSATRTRVLSIVLWIVQVLVALTFLFAGSSKLMMPLEALLAQMQLPLPGLFVRFLGVAEVAGALGLLLPGLLRIQRKLTPLAACGLLLIMLGATVVTLLGGGGAEALLPVVIGLLCVAVVIGRRNWFTAA